MLDFLFLGVLVAPEVAGDGRWIVLWPHLLIYWIVVALFAFFSTIDHLQTKALSDYRLLQPLENRYFASGLLKFTSCINKKILNNCAMKQFVFCLFMRHHHSEIQQKKFPEA
jgi:hypothetical protein